MVEYSYMIINVSIHYSYIRACCCKSEISASLEPRLSTCRPKQPESTSCVVLTLTYPTLQPSDLSKTCRPALAQKLSKVEASAAVSDPQIHKASNFFLVAVRLGRRSDPL